MADLFTTSPPVTVLGVSPFLNGFSYETDKKLFLHGGLRYTVTDGFFGQPAVLKSTDGSAWTGPLGTPPSGFSSSGIAVVNDPAASKIHIFARKSGPPFHLFYFYFNTATDTFSTPVDSGEGCTVSVAARKSTGDLVVVKESADGATLGLAIVSGGAWSGWTTVETAAGSDNVQPKGILIDGSDVAHIIHIRIVGSTTDAYYTSYNGSPSTPVYTGVSLRHLGPGIISGDSLLWPQYSSNLASPYYIQLFEGVSLTSPVWSLMNVATLDGSPGSDFSPDTVLIQGEPWIVWCNYNPSTGPTVRAAKYLGSGVFDTTYTFWDAGANPPINTSSLTPTDRSLDGVSVINTTGFQGELVVHTDVDDFGDRSLVWLAGTFPGAVSTFVCRVY
jgi:hypothetical protein